MKFLQWFNTHGLPQTNIKKQLIDQTAHFSAGSFIVLVTYLIGVPLFLSMLSSSLAGLIREFLQHKSFKLGWGSIMDASFWALGSIAAFYFLS